MIYNLHIRNIYCKRGETLRTERWCKGRMDRVLLLPHPMSSAFKRKNEWHETTFVYNRNPNSERTDYSQYAVFLTNAPAGALCEYSYRWEIESGYKSIKRFMAATTSKDFVLRFFYFVFACLLYSIWRAVDLFVQVALTDEHGRSPIVTAQNTLTLLQKRTGVRSHLVVWSKAGGLSYSYLQYSSQLCF